MIVYCFLTYSDIIRFDIWNQYFNNQSNFKVYIHAKQPQSINISKYTFPINIIQNPVFTKSKSDISIVEATLKLLNDAFDQTPEATHFIFLTQSCIPLYSFNKHYTLISKFDKSIISCIKDNKKERYYSLSNVLKSKILYQNFYKQQPNMILIKEDVQWFLNNNFINDFRFMECPDEHYFINLIINIYKKGIILQQINFCNPDIKKTQAINFNIVNSKFINQIRSSGFLFMRKVIPQSQIDISTILS